MTATRDGRPSLADRLPTDPQIRERDAVLVVLAELIDEQNDTLAEQNLLLNRQNLLLAQQNMLLNRAHGDAGGSDEPATKTKGGQQVLLREPELPPEDTSPEPAKKADLEPAKATRPPAKKVAAPAKKTTTGKAGS